MALPEDHPGKPDEVHRGAAGEVRGCGQDVHRRLRAQKAAVPARTLRTCRRSSRCRSTTRREARRPSSRICCRSMGIGDWKNSSSPVSARCSLASRTKGTCTWDAPVWTRPGRCRSTFGLDHPSCPLLRRSPGRTWRRQVVVASVLVGRCRFAGQPPGVGNRQADGASEGRDADEQRSARTAPVDSRCHRGRRRLAGAWHLSACGEGDPSLRGRRRTRLRSAADSAHD